MRATWIRGAYDGRWKIRVQTPRPPKKGNKIYVTRADGGGEYHWLGVPTYDFGAPEAGTDGKVWLFEDGGKCSASEYGNKEKPGATSNKLFFILWQPESSLPPTVRFGTYDVATAMAKEMAIRHGKPFYVMKAMCLAEPPEAQVKITDLW